MRQDVYGVAYAEAKSELLDITRKFEQLKARKARLEGVVAAVGSTWSARSANRKLQLPLPMLRLRSNPNRRKPRHPQILNLFI